MHVSIRLRIFAAALMVLPTMLFAAQDLTLKDALNGGSYATSIKPADLPDDLHAARIALTGASTDFWSNLMPSMMFLGNGRSANGMDSVMRVIDVSWTKGDVVHVAGHDFLVTYKLDLALMDLAKQTDSSAAPQPIDAPLKLNLIRTDEIRSISPLPELTKGSLMSALHLAPPTASDERSLQSAKKTATLGNVKQMALCLLMYTNDYDDVLPYAQSTKAVQFVTYPYVKNVDIFKTLNPNGGQFQFNMAIAGVESSAIPSPAETIAFYESNAWPDGTRAVAYVDGHAKFLSTDEWQKASATLHLKLKPKAKPLPLNYGSDFQPTSRGESHAVPATPAPPAAPPADVIHR